MAKWIVARTIRRGTSYIVAGTILDDALVDVQSLIAAGEQLVDATIPTYASASDRALAARARGGSFEECDSIMLAAASVFDTVDLWSKQPSWKVDPVNGVDTAVGTPAAPIKTWGEFARRVRRIACAMSVLIAGDLTEALIGFFVAENSTASLDVNGVPTVLAVATGTTFTDPVRSGAQAMGTMTSGSVASFATYGAKMLRVTGGTKYAPVIGTSGAAPLLPYWFDDQAFSNAKPVDGTSVDVLDLVSVPTMQLSVVGMPITVRYLKCTSTAFGDGAWVKSDNLNGVSVIACHFAGNLMIASDTYFMSCLLTGAGNTFPFQGVGRFLGGGGKGRGFFVGGGLSSLNFQGFIINGEGTLTNGVYMGNGVNAPSGSSSVASLGGTLGLGIFNCTGDAFTMFSGAYAGLQSLFGNGNGGFGFKADYGARAFFSNVPTITGTSGDLRVGGGATAIPPLTAGAAVPAASALATWANLTGAPFNKRVLDYTFGTSLVVV